MIDISQITRNGTTQLLDLGRCSFLVSFVVAVLNGLHSGLEVLFHGIW